MPLVSRLSASSILTGITYITALIQNAYSVTLVPRNSKIVIFGDSLSDTGDGSVSSAGNNIYCHDIVNSTRTCAPITNGDKTWPNYLSDTQQRCSQKYMGLSKPNPECNLIMAFASAESNAHWLNDLSTKPYSQYTNCSYPQGNSTWDCIPSAIKQIQLYEPLRDKSDYQLLWIGGNDFFNNIEKIIAFIKHTHSTNTALSTEGIFKSLPELSHLLKNIKQWIHLQLQAGAAKDQLLVGTLLDFSYVPAARELAKGNKLILDGLSVISFILNHEIEATVRSVLPKEQVLPFHEWIKTVFSHPEKYGINKTLAHRSCTGDEAQPKCDEYAFFNGKHPTTKTHEVIAHFVSSYLFEEQENETQRSDVYEEQENETQRVGYAGV